MREIKAGEYYRHFKGGLYHVTGIARDADTEKPVVVYQALYGDEELWVRDYEEFAGEVDRQKLFSFDNLPYAERARASKPGQALAAQADRPGQAERVVLPQWKG